MGQDIGIGDIKKDLLDPVVLIHRVKGHSDLIKKTVREFTTEAVIDDLKVCLLLLTRHP